jgi:hypothetical protein
MLYWAALFLANQIPLREALLRDTLGPILPIRRIPQ